MKGGFDNLDSGIDLYFGKLDNQDRILCRQTDQRHQTDLKINVIMQARLKELEQKKLEAENSEIVDIVRGMSISLTELPLLFEKLKDGGTLGQSVPKSEEEKKEEN